MWAISPTKVIRKYTSMDVSHLPDTIRNARISVLTVRRRLKELAPLTAYRRSQMTQIKIG